MVVVNILFFVGACILLILSGSFLVRSLTKIAAFLRMSEFVAGFIIMAFSTSIPELFVGITSALAKNPALALGTVIGSNIADMTLVIGVAVVLARGIKVHSKKTKRDALYMVFIAALPIVLMIAGDELSRVDGAILLGVFLFYIINLLRQKKEFSKKFKTKTDRWSIAGNFIIFTVALGVLFFSAESVVKYATLISIDFALPPIIIGLFLIAIGTSLPELVFETQAVLKKHTQMALGDIIGSVVANSTLVLGVTALIYPISADFLLFLTSGIFMVITCFLFATFLESGSKLYLKEGLAMILLYSFFIIIEFYVKTLGG